jgi:shikimate dehydrogenase
MSSPSDRTALNFTGPILAGVVGAPIDHSLSPLIHTIWAHRASVNGYYIPLAVPPTYDAFAQAMASLHKIGFAGVNVTLPHKQHALRYAARASDIAVQAGAANMLTFTDDGPHADNSDVEGFANAVKDKLGGKTAPQSALLLGAGGGARGVILALKQGGTAKLQIANRTREKAETIAAAFGMEAVDWETRSIALASADIVVNTTSLGMSGQPPLEIDLSGLAPNAVVADIVYSPLETPLLKAAKARGAVTIDGLDMLMHQAAPGFRAWFGGDAHVDEALRHELVLELERRQRR